MLLLLAGALVASCSSDELGISGSTKVSKIVATISSFEEETDEGITRTSYSYDSSRGYEAVWAEGDILGIYPVGGDQVAFPLSEGIGTASASFNGGAWALKGTYRYAAYYPFSTDNYTIPETEIPVSYLGQKQTGNNTTSHFAAYDYMAAAATQPNAAGVVTLPFEHLGTYLVFPLTLPKAGTYTKLTLTSSVGEFITEGTIDLSAAKPAITATATSASISMDLDNIVLTAANQVLTVNMLIAPVNLTGSTITISVTDSNGDTYSNMEKAWTRSATFEPNKTSRVSRTLSYSGTSGTIEGGGGVEDDDEASTNMHNGHEYVDLGVVVDGKPVYWATTNIGADSPADYGLYFAWGETVGYTEHKNFNQNFDWASYSSDLCGGSFDKMKKYCTDSFFGTVDNKTVLDPEDDAAHENWQGAWCMPTKEELDALCTQCDWTWTTMENSGGESISGYKVSNKTDSNKYIFLPAAGLRDIGHAGLCGSYWSSSLGTTFSNYAYYLGFSLGDQATEDYYRCYGRSIRPVCQ